MELFFDTETTGLVLHKAPHTDPNQPHIIQIAAILSDEDKIYSQFCTIVDPSDIKEDWSVSPGAENVHGISKDLIKQVGAISNSVYETFMQMVAAADTLICHNVPFDKKLVMAELSRLNKIGDCALLGQADYYCTMNKSTDLVKIKSNWGYKWPKLSELHRFLFNEDFEGAHDALEDVKATRRCYYEMKRRGY